MCGWCSRATISISRRNRSPPNADANRRMHDLDRDVARVLEVAREVHGRHSAASDLPRQAIALGQRVGESRAPVLEQRGEALGRRPVEQRRLALAIRDQPLELGANAGSPPLNSAMSARARSGGASSSASRRDESCDQSSGGSGVGHRDDAARCATTNRARAAASRAPSPNRAGPCGP